MFYGQKGARLQIIFGPLENSKCPKIPGVKNRVFVREVV